MKERIPDSEFAESLAEFEALAGEMGVPYATGRWDIEVVSPGGRVVQSESFNSQSWLRNYVNLLCGFVLSIRLGDSTVSWGDSFINFRELDGTIVSLSTAQAMESVALVGADGRGILVGSGTTAESLDDFALAMLIDHGRAAGELYYYAVEGDAAWQVWSWDTRVKKFASTIWRFFLNDSGGSVDVKEAGIANTFTSRRGLVVRDVFNSTVTVPDLNILRVKYTVDSTVFPG